MGEIESSSASSRPESSIAPQREGNIVSRPEMTDASRSESSSAPDASSKKENWVVLIKEGLEQHAHKKERTEPKPDKVMRRVRNQLRKRKPEHFTGEEFSFGLFDRPPLDLQTKKGERYKLAVASLVLELLEDDWEQLCRKVVPEATQNLYDEFERDPLSVEEAQSVLTLDAVFLACYLGVHVGQFAKRFRSLKSSIGLLDIPPAIDFVLTGDLFKVENQMPLDLIRRVLTSLVQRAEKNLYHAQRTWLVNSTLTKICGTAISRLYYLLPGTADRYDLSMLSFDDCDNFLDCIYHAMCNGMEEQPCDEDEEQGEEEEEGPRYNFGLEWLGGLFRLRRSGLRNSKNSKEELCALLSSEEAFRRPGPVGGVSKAIMKDLSGIVDEEGVSSAAERHKALAGLPSAAELHKAGVEFMGRKGRSLNVELKAGGLKATLYLPTIEVENATEALWRNLLVYEEDKPQQDFCYYLMLMDVLIDSPDDVKVLKSGSQPVILGKALGCNEDVAHIFNDTLLENIYVRNVSKKWRLTFKEISDFHNQEGRKMYWEGKETYCGKPWLIISMVVATILLIMTVLQTYYTVAEYYHSA